MNTEATINQFRLSPNSTRLQGGGEKRNVAPVGYRQYHLLTSSILSVFLDILIVSLNLLPSPRRLHHPFFSSLRSLEIPSASPFVVLQLPILDYDFVDHMQQTHLHRNLSLR